MNPTEIRNLIARMPKVEIHIHLEGAFTFEFLLQLIEKKGGAQGIKSVGDLKNKFRYTDFSHFIETWLWKNSFFRSGVDFEESTYGALKRLHEQNVIYVEPFFSPFDFVSDELSVDEITEATLSGARRAKSDFGIRFELIADIVRNHGTETAIHRLDAITPYKSDGIVGIGLGGSEHDYPAAPFADVFAEAAARGFHLTAHAGEAAGAESVRSALEDLNIERLGHGVRAVEDTELLQTLKERQVPLEICPTSNLKTGIYPSIQEHPISRLVNEGYMVTVNSDDPAMFGAWITDEFMLLHEELGFSLEIIKQLCLNAAHSTFLPEEQKTKIVSEINRFWRGAL